MLVELTDPRIDCGRVEVGPGELVQGGHDADVGGVGAIATAERLGEFPHIAGPDVRRAGLVRHHERQVLGRHPFGQQTHLRVTKHPRRHRPVRDHRRRGYNRYRHGPPA